MLNRSSPINFRRFFTAAALCATAGVTGCASHHAGAKSAEQSMPNPMTPPAMAGDPGMPHLQKHGTAMQFVVDGKPFLVLGGELHNSSASSVENMKPVWPRLAALHLNTVIATATWELIEPVEGQFDFSVIDGLVRDAKANHLKLVLLWFGSYKNGLSSYMPLWVKNDPARFPPAEDARGHKKDILSTFGQQTAAADAKAFAALMRHLRQTDTGHTVIAMQVENEVGMRDDSRDRSPAANAAFDGQVPAELMHVLNGGGDNVVPELIERWKAAGGKTSGTWAEVFGNGLAADEVFMAWYYGRFVEHVAAAGKAEYPIPMYTNAWLDQPGTPKPGDYPSGGPLAPLLNVWQTAAPALDFLAPDLYVPEFAFRCRVFTRAGNPLFIPETNTGDRAGANALFAFGKYDAMGFSPFGIDGFSSAFGNHGDAEAPDPRLTPLMQSYGALAQIAPLVLDAQGTGRMTAVMIGPGAEDAAATQPTLQLGGYTITIAPRHRRWPTTQPESPTQAVLLIATDLDEFVVVTTGPEVHFSRDNASGTTAVASIDEGAIVDGQWVRGRRFNGDQTDHGRDPGRSMSPYRVLKIKLFQRQ